MIRNSVKSPLSNIKYHGYTFERQLRTALSWVYLQFYWCQKSEPYAFSNRSAGSKMPVVMKSKEQYSGSQSWSLPSPQPLWAPLLKGLELYHMYLVKANQTGGGPWLKDQEAIGWLETSNMASFKHINVSILDLSLQHSSQEILRLGQLMVETVVQST